MTSDPSIAAIVIGRNEGARLSACLASLATSRIVPGRIVYVDSGSTDGSVAVAKAHGATVVELDHDSPFTAARARNAGLAAVRHGAVPEFVQMIDGDCAIRADWTGIAAAFLRATPGAAVACGRRRERSPEASIYNRLCDREWDTPIGCVKACGGDAMYRMAALDGVRGFESSLIAGEEPELCVRLRADGWEIWRLDAEMTLHDAAMTRFSQFWRRMRRGGHAYAEGAALHGAPPERLGVRGRNSALFWGIAVPVAILIAMVAVGPWVLAMVAIYPLQVLRIAVRDGADRAAFGRAALLVVGKFAEALGVFDYAVNARRGRRTRLIEYK